jgi:outer membrane receptor for ferrienterochelin and colicins
MKKAVGCSLIPLFLVAALHGQSVSATAPKPASEEKEESDLLSILQQETEVATKTRLNSDYVPGIVTVLEGDQLEAMGIATAWEALGLVPGMQAVLDQRGSPAVIARGIDFPFNSGNIQILINSVSLARPDGGINPSALLIPIEQIDRIEVIRGPGSVVYGDFAFMGLVNIITRKAGQSVYVRGDRRLIDGGGRAAWKSGPMSFAANVSTDASHDAPAPSQFKRVRDHSWFGVFSAESGGFTFSAQTAERGYDPTIAGGPVPLKFDETSWVVDGRYTRELAPKLRTEAEVSYLRSDVSDGTSVLKGSLTKIGVNAVWDRLARQSLLLGADYSISTIDDAEHRAAPAPGQPLPPLQTLVRNVERRVTGVTLEDRIDLAVAVSLTLGARYDGYSDLHSRVTPRASLVWRINDHHILKAQYAEGFRPPTFFELYTVPAPGSSPRYPFEHNDTTELNYVYKAAGTIGRVTLFRSIISDMIRPGGVVTAGKAVSVGQEVELSRQVTSWLKVDANASHANTQDPRIPGRGTHPDAAAADWMGNLAVYYQPLRDTFVGARLNAVGNRVGGVGYDVFDLTLSRQDLFVRGFGLRVGMKNVFNKPVTYVSVRPTGDTSLSSFPGRTAWVQVSWKP